ncbi:MAG: caspase family protein [Candidatus Helarchaeota archaeon]
MWNNLRKIGKRSVRKCFFYFLMIYILLIIIFNPFSHAIITRTTSKNLKVERWAVVIGISDYPGTINDLSFCDDDAISIKKWLMNQNFPESNIKMLINSQATKANIFNQLSWIAENSDGNDYFVFFYSGHGDSTSGGLTAIIPYDWNFHGYITETDLSYYFNMINCSILIAMIDSCLSGGLIDSISGANRLILTASASNEDSYEDILTLRHGVFTGFFLKSYYNLTADLNNDKIITIEEAFNYTYNATVAYTKKVFNRGQHPQLYDSIAGDLFLSPYIEVFYNKIHYGPELVPIGLSPIGFGEPISINISIMLSDRPYQTITIENISNYYEANLNLPAGNYEFQLSTLYSNGSYRGCIYELNIKGLFQSNIGLMIIIISVASTAAMSTLLIWTYKRYNFYKMYLEPKKKSYGGNSDKI